MNVSKSQSEQAYQYLLQEDYTRAATLYEEAIALDQTQIQNYWHLGLIALLTGREEEAQTTWMIPLIEADEEQIFKYSNELFQILHTESQRQGEKNDYQMAWVIRQHARQILPDEVNNLLKIIQISIDELQNLTLKDFSGLGVVDALESEHSRSVDTELLLEVLRKILDLFPVTPKVLRFTKACSRHIFSNDEYFNILLKAIKQYDFTKNDFRSAIKLIEIILEVYPTNKQALTLLAAAHQNAGEYTQGIEVGRKYLSLSKNLADQGHALCLILRGLLNKGGDWGEVFKIFDDYRSTLVSLSKSSRDEVDSLKCFEIIRLFNLPFFNPYLQDDIQKNRWIQNSLSSLAFHTIEKRIKEQEKRFNHSLVSDSNSSGVLKIGFVSHCFRQHSVGWLVRWFFKHYDRDKLQVHLYSLINKPTEEFSKKWFLNNVCEAHGSDSSSRLAEKIYEDKINILVDLDSTTLDGTCELLAFKPAPIQITWLGWDASGIPAIDYYIADPYVLPENAQEYYSETIWRLPQTYIAVDGFEVGVPTLRRDQLEIPLDAVIYFSGQQGFKRHPDTVRLQLQILKQVPNSYFLIKGIADRTTIQQFFTQIAEEEGVDPARLRFLDRDSNEFIHRANLGIADVVLDTYPYNGATTTLETLWMGIPLVTRVGQQFAARNSYAFMMNVGVTEGIAWTDEEYVEWGVCLGTDEALRQQVAWKLRQSRQTSPLWNAKQFTREMEKAFQQMWARYVEG